MAQLKLVLLILLMWITFHECRIQKTKNPSLRTGIVQQTIGEVWPQPQKIAKSQTTFALNSETFQFVDPQSTKCTILWRAYHRYHQLIFDPPRKPQPRRQQLSPITRETDGVISALYIFLTGKCEIWPHHGMDEKYELSITKGGKAKLFSKSVWGILRGLETFSQLVYRDRYGNLSVNATHIWDFPRFPFRGLLLDTSRHYVPKKVILQNLDAMAQSKYNVFHWHIVDDPAFPYQSDAFPNLSAQGAYIPTTHIYTTADVVEVIEYARLRGIRVIAEYDTPGHTLSWGPGQPGLLTPCYKNESGKMVLDSYGPLNPTVNSTYDFLANLFGEIGKLFPDQYIHLGGDEVPFSCWESNSNITEFMKKMHFGTDSRKLESYYFENLVEIVKSLNKSYLVWQEVFDNQVDLKKDTVVHVWKDDPKPMDEMDNITKAGYRAILSSCWYLNDFTMGDDWRAFYPCEPMNFTGTKAQMELVLGGETCLWGEWADATNLMARLWPRALAPAERLWSSRSVNSSKAAIPRFEEHRCRMVLRGFNAQAVNGPGFCPSDYLI